MPDAELTVTTSNGPATTRYVNVSPTPIPLPVRALFEVEVDGLLGFSLIPKCDLAKDLAGAWLHGDAKFSLIGTTKPATFGESEKSRGATMDVTRLKCRLLVGNLLTDGGDPFLTGRTLSDEERVVALAAVEAHRAQKRPGIAQVPAVDKRAKRVPARSIPKKARGA